MKPFQHFLLTRFNVRESPHNTEIVSDPNWLNHRFELFEQFCLPSVAAQTCPDFTWVIFLDESTPDAFRKRLDDHARAVPSIQPVYVTEHAQPIVAEAVAARLRPSTPYVITSRLDNDDAISRDYIERIQAAFAHQKLEVLNFPRGIVWHKGRLYLHTDRSNAFATLVEMRKDDAPLTVCARQHPKLSEVAFIRQLDPAPAWLQAVHGDNRRNRVRGRRVPPEGTLEAFEIDPGLRQTAHGAPGYYADLLLFDHVRTSRELGIAALKAVLRR